MRRVERIGGGWRLMIAAVMALAGLVVGPGPGAAVAAPNFVVFMTDDMDMASLAAMPRVRRLLGEGGVTLDRFYVGVSLCCPSRATFLTGKFAHNTRVLTNGGGNGGHAVFKAAGNERSTIATWLAAAGYRTAMIGKYLNGFPGTDDWTYVPAGWTDWVVPVEGRPVDQYNYVLNVNGRREPHAATPADYGTDVYRRHALDFIDRAVAEGRPFYLQTGGGAPHSPYTPAPRHNRLFPDARIARDASFLEADVSDKPSHLPFIDVTPEQIAALDRIHRRRLQTLQAVDEAVEAVHDRLVELGVLANTYLIFTSDNGFHMGQHRLPANKLSPYETDINVPFLIRGPGIPAGRVLSHLATNADFAPTVAELAGVQADRAVDGRSLAPVLRDGLPLADWRYTIPIAIYQQTPQATQNARFRGLRSRRYTYVEHATGARELYFNVTDPLQLENLAQQAQPDLLAELARRTAELATCSADACRTVDAEPIRGSLF